MAQYVKHPTLDLNSDLDLRTLSSRPELGSIPSVEPARKKEKEKEGGRVGGRRNEGRKEEKKKKSE